MGIMMRIFILFISSIIFLVVGFIIKNKVLKYISLALFLIAFGLAFLVWNALGYM